jgi:hypothetical protein
LDQPEIRPISALIQTFLLDGLDFLESVAVAQKKVIQKLSEIFLGIIKNWARVQDQNLI